MNSTSGVMKSLAIGLMICGFFWTATVGWMYLTLSGIAQPISVWRTLSYYALLLVGPLGLLLGPILVLRGTHAWLGAILTAVACAIFTGWVINELMGLFDRDPLQAPPPYLFYLVLLCLGVLVDLAACFLCRLVFLKAYET